MKKIEKLILVLIILISLIGCKSKEEKMLDYMEKKYGEEFVLGFAGGRGNTLIVQTIPKRYLGTPKERDKYYRGQIFYERNDIGDDYGAVLLKESTNEYFRPKLEKLFGKNILIALDLEGQYFYADFVKEMNRRKENRKIYGERGAEPPLSGGIYIFGRVENEKDREKYRRGIYEFIQYLKQEGMFEYTDIDMLVIDERVMLKQKSEKILNKLDLKNLSEYEVNKRISKALSVLNKEYSKLTQKEKDDILNSYTKDKDLKNMNACLLLCKVASPKFVNNFFRQDLVKEIFDGPKNYNNIEDVKFKGSEF